MHNHRPPPTQQSAVSYPTRLNIFALPTQTLLYVVMVLVIVMAIAASTLGGPLSIGWLLFIFVGLCFRWMLMLPQQRLRKYELERPAEQYPELKALIEEQSRALGLRRVPALLLSHTPLQPHAYSSWQRWFIAMGYQQAEILTKDLASSRFAASAQALVLHELHHIKHRDTLFVGFAGAIISISITLMSWAGLCLVVMYSIIAAVQADFFSMPPSALINEIAARTPEFPYTQLILAPALPSDQEWVQAAQQAGELDIDFVMQASLRATFPFFVSGLLLMIVWWKILRTREFYADAAVAYHQQLAVPMGLAMQRYGGASEGRFPYASSGVQTRRFIRKAFRWAFWRRWQWVRRLNKLYATHPSHAERYRCLNDPAQVFGDWRTNARFLAAIVFGLEILSFSTSAFGVLVLWPMHFFVILSVLLLSLTSIVYVFTTERPWPYIRHMLIWVLAPRTAIIGVCAMVVLVIDPTAPRTVMLFNGAAVVLKGCLGLPQGTVFTQEDTIFFALDMATINLFQLGATLLCVWGALKVCVAGMQRIMTWHLHPVPVMPRITCWILLVVAVTALAVLPPVTSLVLRRVEDGGSLWFQVCVGTGLLVAALGGVWFWLYDRTRVRTLPGAVASTLSRFDAYCPLPGCADALLHPELIAPPYSTTGLPQ